MKKIIALTIMVVMFSAGISKAQEPNMPRREPNMPKFNPNMFRGVIVVAKDANGVITAVKLENRRRGTFNIVLDEKGKELGEKMADKFVEIIGKEETKDNEKWLTVESFREREKPMKRHRPGEPNVPPPPPRGQREE